MNLEQKIERVIKWAKQHKHEPFIIKQNYGMAQIGCKHCELFSTVGYPSMPHHVDSGGLVEYDCKGDKIMSNLEYKIMDAIESAKFRKHDAYIAEWNVSRAVLKCKYCDHIATIIDKPSPNQIDISGSLVALNCDKDKIMYTNSTISSFMYLLWAHKIYIGTVDTESAQEELRDKYSQPFKMHELTLKTGDILKHVASEYRVYLETDNEHTGAWLANEQQWLAELIETARL